VPLVLRFCSVELLTDGKDDCMVSEVEPDPLKEAVFKSPTFRLSTLKCTHKRKQTTLGHGRNERKKEGRF
jgi:hypothetical protein